MSAGLPNRELLTLCQQQHRQILELLVQLTETNEPLDPESRHRLVRQLRQRLSRHFQLERHGLYPSLRRQLPENSPARARMQQFELAIARLLPSLTQFLHSAELQPERSHRSQALAFWQKLQIQFAWEERGLHLLYSQHVPIREEQAQLQVFRKRLLATLHQTRSRLTGEQPLPNPQNFDRQSATRPSDLPALVALS